MIMAFSTLQNMSSLNANDIRGAWMEQKGDQEQVVMFIDNYFTNMVYSKAGRKFIPSSGGKYSIKNVNTAPTLLLSREKNSMCSEYFPSVKL